MRSGRTAYGHEPVDVVVEPRLLSAQRGGVDDRLGERSAAAQADAWERAGPTAAETRRAVPIGDADRAEETEVVEVEHRPGAGGPGRGERAPAECRMDVVRMDDLRP